MKVEKDRCLARFSIYNKGLNKELEFQKHNKINSMHEDIGIFGHSRRLMNSNKNHDCGVTRREYRIGKCFSRANKRRYRING